MHRPDYSNFFLATLPVIDESGLNPSEFNLIRGMYTSKSMQLKSYRRLKPYVGWLAPRDFAYLDMKLLNITRDLRKYISSNVKEANDTSLQYAHVKFRIDAASYQYNLNTQLEVFNEQKQFTRHQIKSGRLKTALMILMTKKMLPTDSSELLKLYTEFNDLFSWKVMNKADDLEKHRKT